MTCHELHQEQKAQFHKISFKYILGNVWEVPDSDFCIILVFNNRGVKLNIFLLFELLYHLQIHMFELTTIYFQNPLFDIVMVLKFHKNPSLEVRLVFTQNNYRWQLLCDS